MENYDEDVRNQTMNLYVFSTGFYDVEGGANALTTTPRTVTIYWAPPALTTPQWNDAGSGAFTSARDKGNDPRLRFRVLDADGYGQGELRSGNVCIQEIEVASAPLSHCQVTQNLVNITKFVSSTSTVPGNVVYQPFLKSQATFSGGTVTITPLIAPDYWNGQANEMGTLGPTTDNRYDGDPAKAYNYDEYPIAWKTGKILRMQAELSAPTTWDEDTLWDATCFLLLSGTNEVNTESYLTSSQKCGSPRVGTPQTYSAFFSTYNETNSAAAGLHRLRWELRFINTQSLNFPAGKTLNTGSIRVHAFRVDEVEFK